MFSKSSFLSVILIGLEIVSAAAIGSVKRQTTDTTFGLYAYNKNITGLPVFYGDGIAYIGNVLPANLTNESVNVTFTPQTSDSTTWTASPNTTDVEWSTSPYLYINPASGAFDSVGFVNSTSDLPTGAVTSGFFFYGQSVMYQGSSGSMDAKFWAEPTSQKDLWILKWNSDGTSQGQSIPVVLKSTPPTTITRMMY
ncbi:hypothetical protein DFP73DRAFT_629058 [Morchella snyderi]|nr:hypothetical protein DFP73DRAFT_629058 [Morchella snyderi]